MSFPVRSSSRRSSSFSSVARSSAPWPFALIAIGAFAGVVAALVSQHVYGLEPCAWCVLQRLIFLLIGLASLLGLAWRRPAVARLAAAVVMLLALAGVGSALWQHIVASKSASCNLTLADRIISGAGLDRLLPPVFEARASCADAAVSMLGVSYALWAALLFLLCAIAAVGAMRRTA